MLEPQGDLLVEVAARDQAQDLALARRQLVELGVDLGLRDLAVEGVEHEAGEPGREDRVAVADPARSRPRAPRRRSTWSRSRGRRRGSRRSRPPRRPRPTARGSAAPAGRARPGGSPRLRRRPACGRRAARRRASRAGSPPPPPRLLPASARTSTSPSSSARTPARNSSWSSTITTLGSGGLIAAPPSPARRARSSSADLGAAARDRADLGAPAGALHPPTIDSRTPRRSAGTAAGSKPGPRSRMKASIAPRRPRRRRGSARLGTRAWRRSAAPRARRRAPPRRARRARSRRPRRPRSPRGGRPRSPRRPRAALRRSSLVGERSPVAGEPVAQLALLAAGERRDLARVVGALLHQGQRLQHRVVQVGGELGALLRADPLGALGGEVAPEPPQERRQDQRQRDARPRPP